MATIFNGREEAILKTASKTNIQPPKGQKSKKKKNPIYSEPLPGVMPQEAQVDDKAASVWTETIEALKEETKEIPVAYVDDEPTEPIYNSVTKDHE